MIGQEFQRNPRDSLGVRRVQENKRLGTLVHVDREEAKNGLMNIKLK